MTQQIDEYYGFRIEVLEDVDRDDYQHLMSTLNTSIEALNARSGAEYGAYLSLCQFTSTGRQNFGRGPLDSRLATLQLHWAVMPKDRDTDKIIFLNDQIDALVTLLDPAASHDFSKHHLRCILNGSYLLNNKEFRLIIAAAILKRVPLTKRRVTLTTTASPTSAFASKFINGDGVKTTRIAFPLSRGLQLRLALRTS